MKRISLGDWIVWNPAASQALGFRPDDAPPGGPALTSLIQFRRTKLICSAHSGPSSMLITFLHVGLGSKKRNRPLFGKHSIRTDDFMVWKIRNIFHRVVQRYYYLDKYCCGKKMWFSYNLNIFFYTNVWIIFSFIAGLRAKIWFHILVRHFYLKPEVRVMACWLIYRTANSFYFEHSW